MVTGVEMFRKLLDQGQAGDNVGVLLRGIKREEIERGQVLCKPGSITPHKKFKAEVYVLKKEEGGRHTPFFNGYRPQFYFRTTDVTGVVTLPAGIEMVMPGDNINVDVELITPIACEERSALRDPRGRPHRRRRRRDEDPRVSDHGEGQSRRSSRSSARTAKSGTTRTTKNKRTDSGQAGAVQVLSAVPQTHVAPGNEVEVQNHRPLLRRASGFLGQ